VDIIRDKKEAQKVKAFISYIKERLLLIQMDYLKVEPNQYRYYSALLSDIEEWGKWHKAFYENLLGKISDADARNVLGIKPPLSFPQFCRNERRKLISYIYQREFINLQKYPFPIGK